MLQFLTGKEKKTATKTKSIKPKTLNAASTLWNTSLSWQFNSWKTSEKRACHIQVIKGDNVRKDSWWLPCNHGCQKSDRFHIHISVDWKTQWWPISAQLMGSVRRKKPHATLTVLPARAEWLLSRKGQKIPVRPPKPHAECRASCCSTAAAQLDLEGRRSCCRALSHTEQEWLWEAAVSPCQGGASMD